MSDFKENIYIVANFGELFLKGKNISFFEKKLFNNLSEKLGNLKKDLSFERKSGGSFHIKLSPGLEEQRILEIEEIIKSTPGIINFFRAYACPTNLEEISEAAVFLAQGELEKRPTIETFGIRAERIEKEAEYSSQELGKEVGSAVWQVIEKDVNLDNPDLEIFIKERKNQTFIFVDKKEAVGGMPVGSSGQALVFLSGGIDSPVAAWRAIKRGLEITAVHFHAVPKTSPKSIEKVEALVQQLEKYQPKIKLILVPIIELQQAIKENCDAKLRLILLRRAMLKIGEQIAHNEFNERPFVFVTGDSLAQVASQTLENLTAINSATDKLILRPLIGLDKSEIIKQAEEIDTYNISIQPHDDACSLFVPKKPETRANLEEVEEEEGRYNLDEIVQRFN